jgi:hypothetical protein
MAVGIVIKDDIKAATQFLTKMQRQQIPFATTLALNATAMGIQKIEKSKIARDLDRPTKQVVNSIRVRRSTKRNLNASVFLLPWAHRFLKYQIHGGARGPRGIVEAVPVSMRLNKYGNIAGRRQGRLGKLINQADKFSATINGVAGIWQRGRGKQRNKKLKLLIAYERTINYSAKFPFYQYAARTVARTWRAQFRRALGGALR